MSSPAIAHQTLYVSREGETVRGHTVTPEQEFNRTAVKVAIRTEYKDGTSEQEAMYISALDLRILLEDVGGIVS